MRQSFSHGRSKAVVVEKVKRRILAPGETPAGARPVTASPDAPSPVARSPTKPPLAGAARAAPAAPAKPTAPPPPKTGESPAYFDGRAARGARPGVQRRARRSRRIAAARGPEAEARREREARDRLEREAAERASARKSFAARRKPISNGSPRTRRAGAFPAANRRHPRRSPAPRPRPRPAFFRERSPEPLAAKRKKRGGSLGVRR